MGEILHSILNAMNEIKWKPHLLKFTSIAERLVPKIPKYR